MIIYSLKSNMCVWRIAKEIQTMATVFGKELRKLRIDYDETIYQMAKKLDMSISYLSAIESGSRNIPGDLVDKLIEKYNLSNERSNAVKQAEAESAKELNVNLKGISPEQRKLIFALSRKLSDISDKECADIASKLK